MKQSSKAQARNSQVHKTAQDGFSAEAEAYERGRPGYPDAALVALIERLGLSTETMLVDLGAGTGKLTARLAPVATLVAVEPVAAMRSLLAQRLPNISILDGTAENIPLPSGYAHAISVAQAFHWFDGPVALREMHRVLCPGGRLGLIWNNRDTSVPWVQDLMALIQPYVQDTPSYRSGKWRNAFEGQDLFSLESHEQFPHSETRSIDDIVSHIASISYIAALNEKVQASVLSDVASKLWALHGNKKIVFPYETDVWVYRRR